MNYEVCKYPNKNKCIIILFWNQSWQSGYPLILIDMLNNIILKPFNHKFAVNITKTFFIIIF